MCGVVGCIGRRLSKNSIIEGLQRLEYRGYDSAGYACLTAPSKTLSFKKAIGHLASLQHKLEASPIDGEVGIGHTRWATHGEVSEVNAHPQFDCHNQIAVVHNGIIENHRDLRTQLASEGHQFASKTDTEVIAHLCERIKQDSLKKDVVDIVSRLTGAYACMIISQVCPDIIIAIRKGSPLCIGIANDHYYIASDTFAFSHYTNQVIFLPDESIALVKQDSLEIFDFNGKMREVKPTIIDVVADDDHKNGFAHYMLKEIYEQKYSIQKTLTACRTIIKDAESFSSIKAIDSFLPSLHVLYFLGAGTSWHAGRIGQFFFEKICSLPTRVLLSSEFRYAPFFPEERSLYVGISQSGETADTLECLRLIKSMGLPTMGLTNVATSTIVRETDGYLLTKAGYEIAVASTKAFSTQLVALYWLAHYIALKKGIINAQQMHSAYDDILVASEVLENSIERYKLAIEQEFAPFYAKFKRFIFLGRHISYPFAMEAALKLKEISYIFSQCYPAGELKHGPIALLDKETPVVMFSNLDPLIYQKILSNAQEVKARNAHLVVFAFEGQDELKDLADCAFEFPCVNSLLAPLAMTGLMQFWVYQIAKELGCPIDKPRNLAKSVTVE